MTDCVLDITLPVDLKTQNTGRGNRWFNSAKIRKQYEDSLADYRREPLEYPVRLEYTRILGAKQRAWDADNVALANKQLQDSLVALGWFHDDSPKWIPVISYRNDSTQRIHGPALRVRAFRDD
ncbi:MAG: hypothetical protein GY759_07200 [Chloroflexi bacterium]|nr:hypothetical protein [Chloroflexota bacterium]